MGFIVRDSQHIELYSSIADTTFSSGIGVWRTKIRIYNNTVHHNGHGVANPPTQYYWITGGLYLFSANLEDVEVMDNIFSDNNGFQIGYSDRYVQEGDDIATIFAEKRISVTHNLIYSTQPVTYPIYAGWGPDDFADICAYNGVEAVLVEPLFVAPKAGNFYLLPESPGGDVGAFSPGTEEDLWWQADFPPKVNIP